MTERGRIAFYDLDGTLVSSNIVTRYAFIARNLPSRAQSLWKLVRLVSSVPTFIALDYYSRRRFNEVFFQEYRGLRREWLQELSGPLFERVVKPSIYSEGQALVENDRRQGFHLVLVTGELDFAVQPLASHLGFEAFICNRLVYEDGIATGGVQAPLIAEDQKVHAMEKVCMQLNASMSQSKAYSDSASDAPMLEAAGYPHAVNPDRRLKKMAAGRGWPVMELNLIRPE